MADQMQHDETSTSTLPPESPSPAPQPTPSGPSPDGWYRGTGRRKTSVARVRLKPGAGKFFIQKHRISRKDEAKGLKTINEYFTEERDRADVAAPLKATNTHGNVDIFVRVHGGGYMGQARAIVLGVARALKKYDPTLEQALRDNGFLTRDAREVERKKYGQLGARRKFQFSKR